MCGCAPWPSARRHGGAGEHVEALLSRRDSHATAVFVVVWPLAALVLYAVPSRCCTAAAGAAGRGSPRDGSGFRIWMFIY